MWYVQVAFHSPALIDCLIAHRDALKDVGVLHRNVSLFNLLLILIHDNPGTNFIN